MPSPRRSHFHTPTRPPGTYNAQVSLNDGTVTVNQPITVTVTANSAPQVIQPIADYTVTQGFAYIANYVNLTSVFGDVDDPTLAYSIVSNTAPALVTPTISSSGGLNLAFNTAAAGEADITLRATDSVGQTAQVTFKVTVRPVSFQVSSVVSDTSTVNITFNSSLDTSALNMFDGTDASVDASDVTLVGTNTGRYEVPCCGTLTIGR